MAAKKKINLEDVPGYLGPGKIRTMGRAGDFRLDYPRLESMDVVPLLPSDAQEAIAEAQRLVKEVQTDKKIPRTVLAVTKFPEDGNPAVVHTLKIGEFDPSALELVVVSAIRGGDEGPQTLNVTIVDGYILPVSPLEVTIAPNFGHAIMIQPSWDEDDESDEQREFAAQYGSLELRRLFRLDFQHIDAHTIAGLYETHLDHICAHRFADGKWIAYTDLLLWELKINVAL